MNASDLMEQVAVRLLEGNSNLASKDFGSHAQMARSSRASKRKVALDLYYICANEVWSSSHKHVSCALL